MNNLNLNLVLNEYEYNIFMKDEKEKIFSHLGKELLEVISKEDNNTPFKVTYYKSVEKLSDNKYSLKYKIDIQIVPTKDITITKFNLDTTTKKKKSKLKLLLEKFKK